MTYRPDLGFDPDALRERYRRERDKRLRPDGNDQYRAVVRRARPPPGRPVRRARTSAAMPLDATTSTWRSSAAASAASWSVRASARPACRISGSIEAGADFGGTWYWNRYPGAQCDIESYIYLPLLEELGYMPKEKYSYRRRDLRALPGHRPPLRPLPRRLLPDAGDRDALGRRRRPLAASPPTAETASARVRGLPRQRASQPAEAPGHPGPGVLPRPLVPHQPLGLRVHRGRHRREPDGAAGQDASASSEPGRPQCSRSPPRRFGQAPVRVPTDARRRSTCAATGPPIPSGSRALTPGWQQRRIDNFSILVSGGFQEEDLVNDGWTEILRNLRALADEARRTFPRRISRRRWSSPTLRRWRRSGLASTSVVRGPADRPRR